MKSPADPQIIGVDQTDNAAVVDFEGDPESAVYPARLLYAAKDLAKILHDQDADEEAEAAAKLSSDPE